MTAQTLPATTLPVYQIVETGQRFSWDSDREAWTAPGRGKNVTVEMGDTEMRVALSLGEAVGGRLVFGTFTTEADAARHLVLVANNRETGSWDAACACGGWSAEGFGYSAAWDRAWAHSDSATGPAVVR
jgi:hypothetical protein